MKKKKKENFNLKEEYKQSWNYIKESKKFIFIVIGVFLFFVLIGFFIPVPEFLYNKIIDFIEELLKQTQNMSQLELIKFITLNNVESTFKGIFFGILLGIPSIISAIENGYLLGFVLLMSVNQDGFLVLWRLLPHGIFELPAVFISLGLGLKLGTFIFQKDKLESFKDYLVNSSKVFLFIIIPLLIIAGIIEGTLIFYVG